MTDIIVQTVFVLLAGVSLANQVTRLAAIAAAASAAATTESTTTI